jgi:Putative ATPase subunit of terminase (gpP-like)
MLECRQLVRRRETRSRFVTFHSTFIAPPVPRRAGGHYRNAVDVKRAADLYAKGWTLRRIAAELGLTATTVSDQLRRAGVTVRRAGPPAHPASTQQILELRDQGFTWNEVAKQVDMTVSGAWSRYRRARPAKPTGPMAADSRGCARPEPCDWRPSSRR